MTQIRMKSHFKRLQMAVGLLLTLSCVSLFCAPLMAKDSGSDLLKRVKPPSSEWQVGKDKKWDKEIGIKGKMPAVNIGLRVQKDMPISAGNFLDQVRTKIMGDPGYQGAEITLVSSQKLGNTTWDLFVIKRKDEINQEFWARSFASDQILMVLYTAVGNYYGQYRNDFLQVLQQANGD